jgi:hypothetical protein
MEENENELIAKVEVTIGDEEKTIDMLLKSSDELDECEKGKIIMLILKDNKTWSGTLENFDGENIELKPLTGGRSLGFEINWVAEYLEEM